MSSRVTWVCRSCCRRRMAVIYTLGPDRLGIPARTARSPLFVVSNESTWGGLAFHPLFGVGLKLHSPPPPPLFSRGRHRNAEESQTLQWICVVPGQSPPPQTISHQIIEPSSRLVPATFNRRRFILENRKYSGRRQSPRTPMTERFHLFVLSSSLQSPRPAHLQRGSV